MGLHLAPVMERAAQDQQEAGQRTEIQGGCNGSQPHGSPEGETKKPRTSQSARQRAQHRELVAKYDALLVERDDLRTRVDTLHSGLPVDEIHAQEVAELEAHLDVVLAENRRLIAAIKARPQSGWKQQCFKLIALICTSPGQEQVARRMAMVHDLAEVLGAITRVAG